MKVEKPYAYCCAEGGGRVEACGCVNKNHGTALFDVPDPAKAELAPCPLCKRHPRRNGRAGAGGVICTGDACEVGKVHRFQTYGADQAEADAAWNALAAQQSGELREAARRICAQARPEYADGFLRGDYDESSTEMRAVLLALASTPSSSPSEMGREALLREAQKRLQLTEGCLDCNADDERFWRGVIQFLEEPQWSITPNTTTSAGATAAVGDAK